MGGAEYVPQIWSKYALANISNINATFLRGARFVLGYNEPEDLQHTTSGRDTDGLSTDSSRP